ASCDDGIYCNGADTCDAQGSCQHAGNPCAEPCVTACSELSHGCGPTPAGELCDDGLACTTDDACDGSGACAGVPDDGLCAGGMVCEPGCATSADGCVDVPDILVTSPDGQDLTECIIHTPGLPNQLGCLECSAWITPQVIDRSDFSGCQDDGWQLDSGNCSLGLFTPTCPLNSMGLACCQNRVCPIQQGVHTGREALMFDKGTCSNEEWRLYKDFDLRAFDTVELCYEFGQEGAQDDELFQINVNDGGGPDGGVLDCLDGSMLPSGELLQNCHILPPAASTWSRARVLFWTHSDDSGDFWMLDTISLIGGWNGCPPVLQDLFVESFDSCPGIFPTGWNGWTISGNPRCEYPSCSPEMLMVEPGSEVYLERIVDTSSAGEVQLCWLAHSESSPSGQLEVEIDTGSGWSQVYELSYGGLLPPPNCAQTCVDLTSSDPAAAYNPSLGLRFHVDNNGGTFFLDEIKLLGGQRCDAQALGKVHVGALVQEGLSSYTTQVSSMDGHALTVTLECRWAGREGAVGSDSFQFIQ
ncbi:MAG: hypothetical protein JXR96_22620, partial [Deltaproteobacteria bacterium]|nr:hypothetical protein [Deltaproteobacteria bacterium]